MTDANRIFNAEADLRSCKHGSKMRHGRILLKRLVLAAVAFCVLISSAGSAELSQEHRVKAAFLYNFAKFIEWPENKTSENFQFCVVGKGPLVTALETIAGKTVRGRAITVQKLKLRDDTSSCHMLFMSGSNASLSKKMFNNLIKQGVVTVGEGERFVRSGGMIGFTIKRDPESTTNKVRVGFAINMDAARLAGVEISSELLKLATVVRGVW